MQGKKGEQILRGTDLGTGGRRRIGQSGTTGGGNIKALNLKGLDAVQNPTCL